MRLTTALIFIKPNNKTVKFNNEPCLLMGNRKYKARLHYYGLTIVHLPKGP